MKCRQCPHVWGDPNNQCPKCKYILTDEEVMKTMSPPALLVRKILAVHGWHNAGCFVCKRARPYRVAGIHLTREEVAEVWALVKKKEHPEEEAQLITSPENQPMPNNW